MAARVCGTCDTPWPLGYEGCAVCLRDTVYHPGRRSITDDEAKSLAANANFERAYARYDLGLDSPCGKWMGETRKEMRRRGAQTPEELGAMEAREEADERHGVHRAIKALEEAFKAPDADR